MARPRMTPPPAADLQALIAQNYPMPRLAIHYRVSENMMRQWVHEYGLRTQFTGGRPRTKVTTGIGDPPERLMPSADAFKWINVFAFGWVG